MHARNAAGLSEPPSTLGPIEVSERLLVDELRSCSQVFALSPGGLSLKQTTARRAKEDFHRLLAEKDAFVVYQVDEPIVGFLRLGVLPVGGRRSRLLGFGRRRRLRAVGRGPA